MRDLIWLPEAKGDLSRLHAFLAPHDHRTADRAVQLLVAQAGMLAEFPEQGCTWPVDRDFREIPVRFGSRAYVIRYRFDGDLIVIVRVWHAREDR